MIIPADKNNIKQTNIILITKRRLSTLQKIFSISNYRNIIYQQRKDIS